MKKQILILVNFIVGIQAFSQTITENYTTTTVYKNPITNVSSATENDKVTTVTYYDGLGRPIQVINHRQSATGNNIIQHIEYDGLGRQTKEYLPFANGSTSLDYQDIDAIDINTFYDGTHGYQNTDNPFSEKEFEASPLNRVLKQSAPGNTWALGSGHEIKLDYKANTTTDNVKLFVFDLQYDEVTTKTYNPSNLRLHQDSYYSENQLYKNITVDENNTNGSGNQTEEFTDKLGKIVLKRIKADDETFDTYYIYDDYGNLTYVIPPLASNSTNINSMLDGLCYQYKYDYRNRLVAKKIPSKQWEFIVYDKLDRVRATGPTQAPFKNMNGQTGWLYTKYDAFNRPILTAWQQGDANETTRIALENQINNIGSVNSLSETKITNSNAVFEVNFPYTNSSYPRQNYYILTLNYYDDYNFGLGSANPSPPTQVLDQDVRDATNGSCKTLATGSWVKIIENSSQITGNLSYTFYKTDRQSSPIFTSIQYPNGGYTNTSSEVDFEGKVLKTITEHKKQSNSEPLTTEENYTYSNQGRLLSTSHKVNNNTVENIATNHYKELGELQYKKVGRTANNPLQQVDYSYNIRGWLTDINDIKNIGNNLFAFKINYNQPENATALYNGNISETYWKTSSDNMKRKYNYSYDGLNRLTSAIYKNLTNNIVNSYNESLTYDKNGNIQSLHRNGGYESATYVPAIDNLEYTYDPNNLNQLKKVVDLTNSPQGFKDDSNGDPNTDLQDDYNYDQFGNMTKDQNKNITNIKYNHLNLPIEIDFTGNRKIYYTYDATGIKLKKDVFNGTTHIITDYTNGYQYKDTKLQFFPTAEGYVKAVYKDELNDPQPKYYQYVYNYTDHLGNIRMSYSYNSKMGFKILDETHYYPFGLKHGKYNQAKKKLVVIMQENSLEAIKAKPVIENSYRYRYNAKEYQNEFDLNWYDYGARNGDPAVIPFTTIDPRAEDYYSQSPYAFASNNPVFFVDINGEGVDTDFIVLKKNRGSNKKGDIVRADPNDGSEYDATDRILQTDSNDNVRTKKVKDANGNVVKTPKSVFGLGKIAKGIIKEGMNLEIGTNTFKYGGEGQPTAEAIISFLVKFAENVANKEISGYDETRLSDGQNAKTTQRYDRNKKAFSTTDLKFTNVTTRRNHHFHTHRKGDNSPSDVDDKSKKERIKYGQSKKVSSTIYYYGYGKGQSSNY